MLLRPLTESDCLQALTWRHAARETLRTPYMLTELMQRRFYEDVISNRYAPHRYWGIAHMLDTDISGIVGIGGLTDIQWENSLAEISLILDPGEANKGYGRESVDLLLSEGFDQMGLRTIFGECYMCNSALGFWQKMVERHNGTSATLPARKRWGGLFYDSYYFSFTNPRFA